MYFGCWCWPGFVIHVLCIFNLLDGFVLGSAGNTDVISRQKIPPIMSKVTYADPSMLDTISTRDRASGAVSGIDVSELPVRNERTLERIDSNMGPKDQRPFTPHRRRLLSLASPLAFGNPSIPRKGSSKRKKTPKPKTYYMY